MLTLKTKRNVILSIIDKKKLSELIKNIQCIETTLGTFNIGKTIGEGGTSIVRKAHIDNLNKEFAIKFLAENLKAKPSKQYKRFKQAYINLFYDQHFLPIVPQLYFGELQEKDFIIPFTIMPYLPKTLKNYRKGLGSNFNFQNFENIFNCLLNNIEKIHQYNIIHRDIKPENIFIAGNNLLIGDFDISKFNDTNHIKLIDTRSGERLANYAFSAPEQSDSTLGKVSNASDWFAFGQVLYWLITQSTIKGQNPVQVKEIDKSWFKYNDLINKLTSQNPQERLSSKGDIEIFLKKNDESIKQFEQENNIIRSNEIFNEILRKNFPGKRNLFKINDKSEIQNLFYDLNNNVEVTRLYYRFYHLTGGDFYIRRIEKMQNHIDGEFWLLNNYEFYINNLWIYKDDVGYDFIVIDIKAMKTNDVFGEPCESSVWVGAGYDQGEYISSNEYEDGYSTKLGKLSNDAEFRERYVKKDLLVISPQFSSMYNAFEGENIKKLFTLYKNNNLVLKEEFLKEIMPPKVLRHISHLMILGY